jgi:hypothetical protein
MNDEDEKFKDGRYLTSKAKYALSLILFVIVIIFIFSGGYPIRVIGWK